MNSLTQVLPFGIYVHVPWCRRRCPYCDFYFEVKKDLLGNGFASKLLGEWESREKPDYVASTLYFGGGTPSLLHPQEIQAIINGIGSGLAPDAEVTLELNPEDITEEYLTGLIKTRINRLSIGIQSFCPASLKYLGRKHTVDQAKGAISLCRAFGFENISIDLITGVFGEDVAANQQQLKWAIEEGISHISMYLLTIEPGTNLEKMIGRGTRRSEGDDEQAAVYEHMREFIQGQGFTQYEISSFARDGHYSKHNTIYWSNGIYLGLGPGAHSMRLMADGSVERRANVSDLNTWWRDPQFTPSSCEVLPPLSAFKEALAFGVRDMRMGVDPACLAQRHSIEIPAELSIEVSRLVDANYIYRKETRLYLTPRGALFADAVSRAFLQLN